MLLGSCMAETSMMIVVGWRSSGDCTESAQQLQTKAVAPWKAVLPRMFLSCIHHRWLSVCLRHPHHRPRLRSQHQRLEVRRRGLPLPRPPGVRVSASSSLFHDIDLLKPISAAVISTPTPVTPPNTEEETPAISPTWCSSDYLHGDAHELVKQDISKQVKLVPVTRMAISAKLSSTFMDAQVLFEDMPQRVYHYLST